MRGGRGASEPRSPGAGGLGSAGARGAWVRCRLGPREPSGRGAMPPWSLGAREQAGRGASEPGGRRGWGARGLGSLGAREQRAWELRGREAPERESGGDFARIPADAGGLKHVHHLCLNARAIILPGTAAPQHPRSLSPLLTLRLPVQEGLQHA